MTLSYVPTPLVAITGQMGEPTSFSSSLLYRLMGSADAAASSVAEVPYVLESLSDTAAAIAPINRNILRMAPSIAALACLGAIFGVQIVGRDAPRSSVRGADSPADFELVGEPSGLIDTPAERIRSAILTGLGFTPVATVRASVAEPFLISDEVIRPSTTFSLSMAQSIAALEALTRVSERENTPLNFDPDDYPVF